MKKNLRTFNYYMDYSGICIHQEPTEKIPVPYWINPYGRIMVDNCPEWYIKELVSNGFTQVK